MEEFISPHSDIEQTTSSCPNLSAPQESFAPPEMQQQTYYSLDHIGGIWISSCCWCVYLLLQLPQTQLSDWWEFFSPTTGKNSTLRLYKQKFCYSFSVCLSRHLTGWNNKGHLEDLHIWIMIISGCTLLLTWWAPCGCVAPTRTLAGWGIDTTAPSRSPGRTAGTPRSRRCRTWCCQRRATPLACGPPLFAAGSVLPCREAEANAEWRLITGDVERWWGRYNRHWFRISQRKSHLSQAVRKSVKYVNVRRPSCNKIHAPSIGSASLCVL